ncbi:MAG: Uma2 family endonuclease [Nocardioides sp.]|nr:Uma2 family endonuclease [Nocardioides sp.]
MDVVTTLPRSPELTRADLDALPEDGRRHELLDGVIVMSASPNSRHQGIVGNLYLALRQACPPELRVRLTPFDVALSERTVLVPDLIVAPATDLRVPGPPSPQGLRGAPLLAIEVLSRSTRRHDLLIKHALLEEAGCPAYWVIDPGSLRSPTSLTAHELVDGSYVEVAHVTGSETWHAAQPFAVDLTPDLLIDD